MKNNLFRGFGTNCAGTLFFCPAKMYNKKVPEKMVIFCKNANYNKN